MNFIILGDKFQKRMKSKGSIGLIKIHGKSILEHQYKNIKTVYPKANIIYIYGFDKKKFLNFLDKQELIKKDIISIYNPNYETLNNVYSLSLANNYLNDNTFVLFGDNILSSQYLKRFNPLTNKNALFINTKLQNKLGCVINENCIENISYDLDNYLAEVYYICKQDINIIKNLINEPKYHNHFIFEIFNKLIDSNKVINPFFLDIKVKNPI